MKMVWLLCILLVETIAAVQEGSTNNGSHRGLPNSSLQLDISLGAAGASRRISQTCGEGQFMKKYNEGCMDCDLNCLPGLCIDRDGCGECAEGFYRSREDEYWPFICLNCGEKIRNCKKCDDGIFDAWPARCMECEEGFFLNQARDKCGCQGDPEGINCSSSGVLSSTGGSLDTSQASENQPPEDGEPFGDVFEDFETAEQSIPSTPRACSVDQFLEMVTGTCRPCDINCESNQCVDGSGCNQCTQGFFITLSAESETQGCTLCVLDGCGACMDGLMDTEIAQCVECLPGYVVVGGQCRITGDTSPNESMNMPSARGTDGTIVQTPVFNTPGFQRQTNDGDERVRPTQPSTDAGCQTKDGELSCSAKTSVGVTINTGGQRIGSANRVTVNTGSPPQGMPGSFTPETTNVPQPGQSTGQEIDGGNIAEQSVPSEPLAFGDCSPGEFSGRGSEGCLPCDENCASEGCVGLLGCLECKPGFFTAKISTRAPYQCKECNISKCDKCKREVVVGAPTQCDRCALGYMPNPDKSQCVPFGVAQTDPSSEEGGVNPGNEDSGFGFPDTTVIGEQSVGGGCQDNELLKKDGTCMQCDANCLPGQCEDITGCGICATGYFRTRVDVYWPFVCADCKQKIPNCRTCLDGVLNYEPSQCLVCEEPFQLSQSGSACI